MQGRWCCCRRAHSRAATASIFYYPWWGTKKEDGKFFHWSQYGHAPPTDLATTFYPARGPYSSSDGDVVRAQMDDIKQAGVSEVITSWWGWGSPEDERLPLVMHAAEKRGLDVAVQIEPYEKWQRTADVLNRDLGHLQDVGIRRVYVYRPFDGTIDDDGVGELIASYPAIEFYAQTTDVSRAAADGFDGVYTYDVFSIRGGAFAGLCARAHAAGIACAPSVGPGLQRVPVDGGRADPLAAEREDVRRHVAGRDRRAARPDHDHELQRVARGHADRAGEEAPTGAVRPIRELRGSVRQVRRSLRAGVHRADDVLDAGVPARSGRDRPATRSLAQALHGSG